MEPSYCSSTYSTKEGREEKGELAGEAASSLTSISTATSASASSMALSSGDGSGAMGSGGGNDDVEGMEKEHMFDKVVTPSDVGKLNRLVIPKHHAEKYFPLDAAANEKGVVLSFEDRAGKLWRFRYSYWNSSQSYVMTKGWSCFVREKRLVAGDTVSFFRAAAETVRSRLFIDWKRRANVRFTPRIPLPAASPYGSSGGGASGFCRNVINAVAPARQLVFGGCADMRPPVLPPPMHVTVQPAPPVVVLPRGLDSVPLPKAASAKRLRLFGIDGESSHDPNECSLRMPGWQTPRKVSRCKSPDYFGFDSSTSSPGSYTGSSLTAEGQYGSRHDLLMLPYQMDPWDKFKFCLHVIKFIVRIKERVRLRQEGNQILNHGSASTDELGKAAERWSAKRIATRRFSKLEAWTQDQQSDMFQLTKVTKRQRIASNQLCDITPWGKLKKYLTAIKFIAIMKAGVKIHQVRKQNWNHVSASTSQLGKEAERLPAKSVALEGFFQPEMWRGTKDLLENDFSELTEVVKIPRLLANKQFCDITPREKLKKCLNAVKFVMRIQGSYTRPLLEPWRKFKFCLNVVKFVVRMKARVRGHQGQKHYSTTHGSAATDELAPSKGIGLEVFCEPEAWSRDVETDGYEVTKVARRERLLKNVQSSTFNKVEEMHSTLHEDIKAWINMKKQYGGDLHHTCVQVGSKVLGRNDIKQLITENILLVNNGGNKCTVICINAGSGHGKTSLLRVLYNDQQLINAFDKRIWIQMSDKLDISMLFRKIIEFATNDHCSITNLRYLQQMVKEEITDKKFILFLDDADIEDRQFWNIVLKVLNVSASGSVVVMATRTATVATLSGLATHSYSLNPLSEENNLMLLQQYATVGTDIQSNPDLAIVAKRFISRFGGNLLKLKAIGGLLCHTDTTSLGNVKLEGSAMPLQLCHDVLPIHLKKCLALCSLFPEGYIFDRHQIILLWISHGCIRPVEGCELEDVAAEYFSDLLSRSFFQHSPFHNDNDEKFVMHELIYKVVKSVSRNRYFKSEDLMDSVPENILHLSLVSSQIQRVQLMLRTEKLKDLQTFLVLQPEGQQYNISVPTLNLVGLDDFFLKFTSLETLDLSHTDIEELPGSIVSMRNLQYLSMTNTSIRALPSELCILSNLQTLKVKDCRFLTELPGDTKNLLKLRHLDVTKELGHVHLPHGIGQLTELRTLPVFHTSKDSSHCCITELGSLHNLRGCLRLSGLDSVKTSSKAQEVNLRSKQQLKDLTLQWHDGGADIDDDDDDEAENVAEQVLEGFQPHANLQELAIRGYEGSAFPTWMQSSSSLPNLVSLTLDSCCNCTQFPAIDQLPSLKFLSIRKMYDVQQLSSDINVGTKFPSLELLNLWEMYGLEELFEAFEGDCPHLRKICISRCPDLKRLPSIPSVNELVLHCGLKFPDIRELGSLASLKIESFHGVKSFSLTPPALPVLKKLEIKSCNELSSVDGLEALTTVQNLKIAGCPKLVLPRK